MRQATQTQLILCVKLALALAAGGEFGRGYLPLGVPPNCRGHSSSTVSVDRPAAAKVLKPKSAKPEDYFEKDYNKLLNSSSLITFSSSHPSTAFA